jgi:hypothetical protein
MKLSIRMHFGRLGLLENQRRSNDYQGTVILYVAANRLRTRWVDAIILKAR